MKVIDFERKGNVIRLYLGADDDKDYWGDDWDDHPYECNAGAVYDKYVIDTADFAFSMDYTVTDAESDWRYNYGSPYSKEDFKQRKAPCLVVLKSEYSSSCVSYSEHIGSDSDDVLKIYFEDDYDKLVKKIKAFGGIMV